MNKCELNGQEYDVNSLSQIGRAEVLSRAFIEDSYSQLEKMDSSSGRDLSVVKRIQEAKSRLEKEIRLHDYEIGGPLFVESICRPFGMALAVAVSLSEEPRFYAKLLPSVQELQKIDEKRFVALYEEVGIASGFLSKQVNND